jgi:uncharacterized protein (TIRG00374 family)
MKALAKSKLSIILSILFSLAVVAYAILKLDWKAVQSSMVGLNWEWLILSLLVYGLNYVLRTMRFQILIPTKSVSFIKLLAVTGLYGMYNYLLPAKSGELTYIVLANRQLKVSLVEGTTSLVASRYLDFVAIAIILPFVLVFYLKSLPAWLIYASLVFCGVVFLASLGLYWFAKKTSNRQETNLHTGMKWAAKIQKILMDLRDGLVTIYHQREHMRLLLLTMAIWLCVYTNFYLIVLSLGYQLSYFQIVVISIFMIPMTLLPFQGFANLGTHEISWVAAFSIFGQPESVALSVAFSSHVILLLDVLLLGGCSFLIISLVNRPSTLIKGHTDG